MGATSSTPEAAVSDPCLIEDTVCQDITAPQPKAVLVTDDRYLALLEASEETLPRYSANFFSFVEATGYSYFVHLPSGESTFKHDYKKVYPFGIAISEVRSGIFMFTGGWQEINLERVFFAKNSVYYHCKEMISMEKPPMLRPRCMHYTIYFENFIYVIGGFDGKPMTGCERYDWSKEDWETLPALPVATSRGSLIGKKKTRTLYMLGGARGARDYTDKVMAFRIASMSWEELQFTLDSPGKSLAVFQVENDPTAFYYVNNSTLLRLSLEDGEVLAIKHLERHVTCNSGQARYFKHTLYCTSNDGPSIQLKLF